MRHQTKKHTLSKAQDQRKALLRSLATELFTYGEIKTTMARAKALRPYAEGIITLAKKGDLNSRRQAAKFIFDKETGKFMDLDGTVAISRSALVFFAYSMPRAIAS